jgi:hypothetical protein
MHRAFLLGMVLMLLGCAGNDLQRKDAMLAAYSCGMADGAYLATHQGSHRVPCGLPNYR